KALHTRFFYRGLQRRGIGIANRHQFGIRSVRVQSVEMIPGDSPAANYGKADLAPANHQRYFVDRLTTNVADAWETQAWLNDGTHSRTPSRCRSVRSGGR